MSVADCSDVVCPCANGVRLTVRAKPGLSRTRAIKIVDIGDGKRAIEVSIAAEAREGKANRALIERIAEEWGLPKKRIQLVVGETSRIKIIEISGPPQTLLATITEKL